MKSITIVKIKCFDNEESSGGDEFRLEIKADGNNTVP
jgi:hypothetical protein